MKLRAWHLCVEEIVIGDGVVDGRRGEQRIEAPIGGGGVVLFENRLDDGALRERVAGLGCALAIGLEVIDVESQHVAVVDGVGDRVLVQFLLEEVFSGLERLDVAVDLPDGGVLLEDRRSGEAEELRVGEERRDGFVGVAELRTVALVEDDGHALVAERGEEVGVFVLSSILAALVAFALLVEGQAKLLDRGDDDLVGVVVGEKPADQRGGVGVFLDAAFLEPVELLAGLAVEVLAVHDEEAFVDRVVGLEEGGSLEGGQRLAAAGGVPDVAVAAVLLDAFDDPLDGVDLIRPHHQQSLLAGDEDGVPADHPAQRALREELLGEVVEVCDLAVVFRGELVDRKEALLRVEGEVAGVVVGEIPGICAVADDEKLHETQQRAGVAVAGVVLVIDDLLHGSARADAKRLQLDLNRGNAVDQEHHVVAVVAVVGVDSKLVDDFKGVLAPVLDVDQGVVQRRAIVTREAVDLAECARGGENIGRDDLVAEALELAVSEPDAVEGLELLAEVAFERGAVFDVIAIDVLQIDKPRDEGLFELALWCGHGHSEIVLLVVGRHRATARIRL